MPDALIARGNAPVNVGDLREHLRLVHTADDAYLAALIRAAVDHLEQATIRGLAVNTYRHTRASWPADRLVLPWSPLVSVESVKYYDATDTLQTLDSSYYRTITHKDPGWIEWVQGKSLPALYRRSDAVQVEYKAGYSACPWDLRQAVLALAAHWYEHREAVGERQLYETPAAVDAVVRAYRVYEFV